MEKFIKKINTSPLIRRRVISGDAVQTFPKTFGISLKKLIEKEEFAKVPRIVTNICEFLLINGLETEGIFRVNGNNKAVESIKLLFEENYSLDMSNYTDVYAVASVLKLFIRELPDGLIPDKIAVQFVEVYKHNSNNLETCIDEFRNLLCSLPQENFNLLKYLCQFLTKIAEKEKFNKMNGINLGIVFGPNIFRCSHDIEGLKLQSGMNSIMSCFISHFEQLFKHNQREANISSSCFGLESPLITQTMSIDGHKSSPSLSGDFDLSSSNDNQMFPAPLPTSISFNLQQAISNCVSNHLSEDIGTSPSKLLDIPNDYRMIRTSSMPHSISKYSNDINNEYNDLSLKSTTEPTAQPRSNISSSSNTKLKQTLTNSKNSNRKPLLVTQESWNDILDKNDITNFNYLDKSQNAAMIDDILPDWQGQNNLIDLDDFDGDDLMNETKENSIQRTALHKADRSCESTKKSESVPLNDSKLNTNEIQNKIKYLRKKLREFEDNFERQHGCRPQSIEKTGNSQVQEWLTELVHLRELLNTSQQDTNVEGLSGDSIAGRGSQKLNIYDASVKNSSQMQSGASTFSGVSEHMGTVPKQKVISTLDNINTQNMSVVQYLEYLNTAIESQRRRAKRPESFSEMTKEQLEDEKMDLQKCLLHFERIYGRPREYSVKQIMKPLYDRYRLVKRIMKMPDTDIKGPVSTVNSQVNGEYGNSATTVSSRSRGHSNVKHSEEEAIANSKSKKNPYSGTLSHDSNNQMSQSFTNANEMRSNYWRQTSSSGSWKSGTMNMSQENMNKYSTSQNSNTALRIVPTEPLSNKHGSGSNLILKYQSSVPLPIDNPSSFTPIVYNTPIHSAFSTKSFNSSVEDIMAFRPCNTMSKAEIITEKDVLLIEKRRLQKLLKDFEHGLEKITGRKVEKSDRDHMRTEYDRYKSIKCRLRMLDKELER